MLAKLKREKAYLRKRLYVSAIEPMIPALVGSAPGLPPVDAHQVAVEAADFICGGPIEIYLAMYGAAMALNGLALVMRGKLFKSMELTAQKEFLMTAFDSKLWALRGLSVLAGLSLKVVYFNQDTVCKALGYDRAALIEDALKHQVSRDSNNGQAG
jgi:hypothetical protein